MNAPVAHEVDQIARRSLRALLRKEGLRDGCSTTSDLPSGQRLATRDGLDASFELPVGRSRTRRGRGWKSHEPRKGDHLVLAAPQRVAGVLSRPPVLAQCPPSWVGRGGSPSCFLTPGYRRSTARATALVPSSTVGRCGCSRVICRFLYSRRIGPLLASPCSARRLVSMEGRMIWVQGQAQQMGAGSVRTWHPRRCPARRCGPAHPAHEGDAWCGVGPSTQPVQRVPGQGEGGRRPGDGHGPAQHRFLSQGTACG